MGFSTLLHLSDPSKVDEENGSPLLLNGVYLLHT